MDAIGRARQQARAVAWGLAGNHAPNAATSPDAPVVIDLDATLVAAHSEKEHANPTFKRGFGFHPLVAFADHGGAGTGEMLAIRLRPGNAGSNTAADHIHVVKAALGQLPGGSRRPGKRVLIRADGAGGTKQFVNWLTDRRLSYSVGSRSRSTPPSSTHSSPTTTPGNPRWTPTATSALDADGDVRDGAAVAELTGILNLDGWPDDMRVIVRRERPHPGAQLRFDDVDGYRLTAFATNTRRGQLQQLELRHRRRARCEDRIRQAKDTGLRNLPLNGFDHNRIWCAIVALATEITAWAELLAHPTHEARRWEPKRLRHRLFTIPASIARHGRRTTLHLSNRSRGAGIMLTAIGRLRALPAPSG